MKRLLMLAVFALVSIIPAMAGNTTVTGTVKDANGVPYANGTVLPIFVNVSGGATPTVTSTGANYFPPTTTSIISSTGTFSVTVGDNTTLSPSGTTWNFLFCSTPNTSPIPGLYVPQCFTLMPTGQGITISGSTQSITTNINNAGVPLLSPSVVAWGLSSGGSGLSQVATQSVLTNGTSIAPGTTQSQNTVTITGLTTNSACSASPQTPLPPSWQTGIQWYVTVGTNTATLVLINPTSFGIQPVGNAVNIKCIL